MDVDPRVRRRYELVDEEDRLWQPGLGELVRLRTWDIFRRLLPPAARIADVGGGPGAHSAYLAAAGHDVVLFDPLQRHIEAARARAGAEPQAPFRAQRAEARSLPLADASMDVVLLMGPLYHLVDQADRIAALREAARVLRPGGHLLAEAISRNAWVMDATRRELLDRADTWDDIDWITRTGQSKDPAKVVDGTFWAYFHHPHELAAEIGTAGYDDVNLIAVEGFAWLLDDLSRRMQQPDDLLRAVRHTEAEPSMLGVSAHVIGHARR
jgi:SAM-dependent methyltransferase